VAAHIHTESLSMCSPSSTRRKRETLSDMYMLIIKSLVANLEEFYDKLCALQTTERSGRVEVTRTSKAHVSVRELLYIALKCMSSSES
jgi:hypothetical protein